MRQLAQLLFAGVALGALYGLVALGFVVVYRATLVINFAHGSLVLLGAYLTYALRQQVGLPFSLALLLALVGAAMVGLLIERVVLRRMVGQPVLAVIMITIGLAISIEQIVVWAWGPQRLSMGDPWGLDTVQVAGVRVAATDIARLVTVAAALGGLWLLFNRSSIGLAMRATASDQEAALAQGIEVRRVVAVSWAVAAAAGTLAGVLLAAGPRGLDPTLGAVALVAFPAIILGGLDSPAGAVLGGLVIGLVEVLTAGYGPRWLPDWMGLNVHTVMPYVVLVAALLLRPHGLFGTRLVRRA